MTLERKRKSVRLFSALARAGGWGCFLFFVLFCALVSGADEAHRAGDDPGKDPLPKDPLPKDPLPLKRVVLPPGRITQELERLRQGLLVQLPLRDLESLVHKARQVQEESNLTPSLVRSIYAAKLAGNSLAEGTGTWTVHHPGSGPALLPVLSLDLALKDVKNEMGGNVVLGELPGKNLVLLVEKPGTQIIYFDWSARGATGPGGLHFDLKLPPCPLSHLELKIPADQVVSLVKSSALLVGPLEAEDAKRSIWRLNLTGKSQVEFDVRPLAGSVDLPPAQLAQVISKQEITPEKVKADFEFQVEVLHHPIRELVFELDPVLKPIEVTLRNAEIQTWQLQPAKEGAGPQAKKENLPNKLVIQLREPFQGTLAGLRIRCQSQGQPNKVWVSPFLRLGQSLTRGETLKLHLHPDVQLEKWDPGSFHLLSSTTANDGTQVLTLVDPRTGTQAVRRPSCLCKTQGVELHTAQKIWWHLGPTGSTLDSESTFDLTRGNLFQLAIKLPKGGKNWQVEKVELDPPDLMQSWSQAGPVILVDLRQGLSPRAPAKLTLRLHAPWDTPQGPGNALLDFPDLEPFPPSVREGSLHIGIDPMFQASVLQNSVPAVGSEMESPLGDLPVFSFVYRDQPVTGKVKLTANRFRLGASSQTQVVLGPAHAQVQTRLELEPLAGSLEYCDLLVGGVSQGPWRITPGKPTGQGGRLERLVVRENLARLFSLGNPVPWLSWSLPEMLGPREMWRLHFSPPLTQRAIFLLETTCPRNKEGWDLPIFIVKDAPRLEGEVNLRAREMEISTLRTRGLVANKNRKTTLEGSTSFLLTPSQVPRLKVQAQPAPPLPTAQEQTDQAKLLTYVLEDGRVFHHFSFQVAHWHKKEIPVVLPDRQAKILGAKVEGRWLENIRALPVADGLEVRIPATLGPSRERIEIFYSSEPMWSTWPGWTHLAAPWPLLPVAPLTQQRGWRLAPGLAPLGQEAWQNLSLPQGLQPSHPDLLRQTWQVGEPWLQSWLPWSDQDLAQRQVVLDAELSLRKKWSSDFNFGRALRHLIFDHLTEWPLVVDAQALASAEVTPFTPLGPLPPHSNRPFWENLGLVYIPCPVAPVLTTRKQLDNWQRKFAFQPRDLAQAVAQALATGQDSQGLFQTAAYWLRHASGNNSSNNEEGEDDFPRDLFSGQIPVGWSAWQAGPGQAEATAMVVLRVGGLRTLGLVLGLATLVLFWNMGRFLTGVWFFRGFLLWVTLLTLAFIWLPHPINYLVLGPLLIGILVGCLVYLVLLLKGPRRLARPSLSTQTMVKAPGSAVTVGLLFFLGWFATLVQGGGTDPFTILILQGAGGNNDQAKALVSPDLLQRLRTLTRGPLESQEAPLLVRANYQGRAQGNQVIFQVEYLVYNFTDKGVLHLPLSGVDLLEGSFLNGEPVYPVAHPGPQGGYTLTITRKEFNRLSLTFSTPWHGMGDYQEMRFGIPSLLQNHLHMTMPRSWQDVQVVHCQGVDTLTSKGHLELDARLGRENQVVVRWRQEATGATVANLEVQEAYLWDLRPTHFSLTGLLNYTVTKGSVSQLSLTLPEEAEIRSVELGGTTFPSTRIQKWRVIGKEVNRQLQVELANPITGKFHLVLNLLPRVVLEAQPLVLRLPLPLKAKHHEGLLAYRLEGWETTDKTQSLAITGIAPELLAKVWKAAAQRDPGIPTKTYSFRRTAGNALLQVNLRPLRPTARQEIQYQVQPSFTDIAARLQVQGTEEDFSLVQWEVPASVTLADVSGPNVHHWSRQDALVQVWMQQPTRDVALTLTGWTKNPVKQMNEKPGRLVLPVIRPLQVQMQSSLIMLKASPGLVLEPEKLTGLTPERGPLQYQVTNGNYSGSFGIRLEDKKPGVRVLTMVDVRHGGFTFHTRVEGQLLRSEPTFLTLKVRHWPGTDIHLDMLVAGAKVEHWRDQEDHYWKIRLPGKQVQPISLELRGQRSLDAKEKMTVPDVEVLDVQDQGRWIALASSQLEAAGSKGLAVVKDLPRELRLWPGERSRLQREALFWKVKSSGWQLQVQARSSLGALPWQILWSEQEVHEQKESWIHQASYLITTRSAADIQAVLPTGARFLAASWGEEMLVPRLGDARHVGLVLPQAREGEILRLRWFYEEEEGLLKPRLEGPTFAGVEEVPSMVTLWLPPRLQPRHPPPSSAVELLLHRARGQMLLSSLLAEQAKEQGGLPEKQILAAQKHFQEWLRHAEYELQMADRKGENPDKNLGGKRAALKDLRQQNQRRAQQGGYDSLRQKGEGQAFLTEEDLTPTALELPEQGLPLVYSPALAGKEALLQTAALQDFGFAVLTSQLLLVGFLALLFLTSMPRLFRKLPLFWPEQLMAVALVGTHLFGFSLLGMVLFLAGGIGRLTWVAHLLIRVGQRLFPRTAEAESQLQNP